MNKWRTRFLNEVDELCELAEFIDRSQRPSAGGMMPEAREFLIANAAIFDRCHTSTSGHTQDREPVVDVPCDKAACQCHQQELLITKMLFSDRSQRPSAGGVQDLWDALDDAIKGWASGKEMFLAVYDRLNRVRDRYRAMLSASPAPSTPAESAESDTTPSSEGSKAP